MNAQNFAATEGIPPVIGFDPALEPELTPLVLTLDVGLGGELLLTESMVIDAGYFTRNPVLTQGDSLADHRLMQINAPGRKVSIYNLHFEGVTTTLDGAGVWVTNNSIADFQQCLFSDCQTTAGNGGGLAVTQGAGVLLDRCALVENEADNLGGGIYAADASFVELSQCTLAENEAARGGGIADAASGSTPTILLRHCTIARNVANLGLGGGIGLHSPSAEAEYTILAENLPDNFGKLDTPGALQSGGYNIDDGNNISFGHGTDIAGSGNVGLTELVPYNKTRAIPVQYQSESVDSGDPSFVDALMTDQGGVNPRVQTGRYTVNNPVIDRGAVELNLQQLHPDLDMDGMPNFYEELWNFNALNPADATEDADGDGESNRDEGIAGTIPLLESSVLRIVSATDVSALGDQSQWEIEWTSEDGTAGLVYDIRMTEDLSATNWTLLDSDIPPAPAANTTKRTVNVSQSPVKSQVSFRVEARRQPVN
jgi:hypothetical protein